MLSQRGKAFPDAALPQQQGVYSLCCFLMVCEGLYGGLFAGLSVPGCLSNKWVNKHSAFLSFLVLLSFGSWWNFKLSLGFKWLQGSLDALIQGFLGVYSWAFSFQPPMVDEMVDMFLYTLDFCNQNIVWSYSVHSGELKLCHIPVYSIYLNMLHFVSLCFSSADPLKGLNCKCLVWILCLKCQLQGCVVSTYICDIARFTLLTLINERWSRRTMTKMKKKKQFFFIPFVFLDQILINPFDEKLESLSGNSRTLKVLLPAVSQNTWKWQTLWRLLLTFC